MEEIAMDLFVLNAFVVSAFIVVDDTRFEPFFQAEEKIPGVAEVLPNIRAA